MSDKDQEVNVVSHSLSLVSLITGLELHCKERQQYKITLIYMEDLSIQFDICLADIHLSTCYQLQISKLIPHLSYKNKIMQFMDFFIYTLYLVHSTSDSSSDSELDERLPSYIPNSEFML